MKTLISLKKIQKLLIYCLVNLRIIMWVFNFITKVSESEILMPISGRTSNAMESWRGKRSWPKKFQRRLESLALGLSFFIPKIHFWNHNNNFGIAVSFENRWPTDSADVKLQTVIINIEYTVSNIKSLQLTLMTKCFNQVTEQTV